MTAVKKRGLSRGLDELLGGLTNITASAENSSEQLINLPIDVIQRGKYQPRQSMQTEALQELAESIRHQGVIQPIVVRHMGSNRYEIIAGERRWRAAQLAGLSEIPALIKDVSDEDAGLIALIENIQRENLNIIQEAAAFQRLQDEFAMTHQQIATAVGKSRSAVSNLLRLINLSDDAKQMLERGEIEMGHARALLALSLQEQTRVARIIFAQGLNVRAAESLVRRLLTSGQTLANQSSSKSLTADVQQLQQKLAEQLGAKVQLQHNAKGKGKLVIQYNSLDELDGILAHIR
jgi:ParB family chromosome partitioning protein